MGFKSYEHDVEVNKYYGLITQETWRNMSFQKISSPMALGYDFKILKLKSTVYLGWKYSYYLKGKVVDRSKNVFEENPDNNSDDTHLDDPFKETDIWSRTANRWNRGLFIGMELNFKKRTSVNVSYSTWQYVSYSRGCFGYGYNNNDLTLSLKYSIFSGRKSR